MPTTPTGDKDTRSLDDLGKRLDKARARGDRAAGKFTKVGGNPTSGLGMAMRVSVVLVSAFGVGFGIGLGLGLGFVFAFAFAFAFGFVLSVLLLVLNFKENTSWQQRSINRADQFNRSF